MSKAHDMILRCEFRIYFYRKRSSSKLWIVLREFIAACNFSAIARFETSK
jgi:hypothetical protein